MDRAAGPDSCSDDVSDRRNGLWLLPHPWQRDEIERAAYADGCQQIAEKESAEEFVHDFPGDSVMRPRMTDSADHKLDKQWDYPI